MIPFQLNGSEFISDADDPKCIQLRNNFTPIFSGLCNNVMIRLEADSTKGVPHLQWGYYEWANNSWNRNVASLPSGLSHRLCEFPNGFPDVIVLRNMGTNSLKKIGAKINVG